MSRKIDGNLTKSGPVPSLPLRRNHEKQSHIRGRKHMLYVVFPPRFNMFPFCFNLRNQVISSCDNASLETAKVISSCNKKKKIPTIKSLQYEVFPGGQPSRYYPRPTGFNFGDRTSPSFFPCGVIVDNRRS